MTNVLNAQVYVGTYAKYNNGSLSGKWMNLADYTTKKNFVNACRELHKDERDPEFMFQDYEDIPTSQITESSIDGEIWHTINSIKKNAPDRAEEFATWCEDNGAEADYNSLRDFLYGEQKKQPYNPYAPMQMSKEQLDTIIDKLYSGVYDTENDRKYHKSITSNAAYFDGKLVLFDKPKIKTQFPFDDENEGAMNMYGEFGKDSKIAHKYFIAHNIDRCKELRLLDYFLDDEDAKKPYKYRYSKLYFYKEDANRDKYTIGCLDESNLAYVKRWYPSSEFIQLTKEQEEQLHKLLQYEYAKFNTRLQQYLKRYGVTKCNSWSYWANA